MRSLFVILNWLPIWADFFLTEIEIHENKIVEKDLKAALNFATHGLSNVAELDLVLARSRNKFGGPKAFRLGTGSYPG